MSALDSLDQMVTIHTSLDTSLNLANIDSRLIIDVYY